MTSRALRGVFRVDKAGRLDTSQTRLPEVISRQGACAGNSIHL
jgi:hypothetical protein